MTLTERAWQLVVESITVTGDDTTVLAPENAFIVAEKFEAESAKHEAPKTEGRVFYSVGWSTISGIIINPNYCRSRKEAEESITPGMRKDGFFLVEVRRVK